MALGADTLMKAFGLTPDRLKQFIDGHRAAEDAIANNIAAIAARLEHIDAAIARVAANQAVLAAGLDAIRSRLAQQQQQEGTHD